MKLTARRWLWILVVLVGALALAALTLPRLLDVERYRARIEAVLGQATGCRVSLGAIDLRVFPSIAVRVSPVSLVPAAGNSKIEVGAVEARAALWPLLRGALEVHEVRLVRPSVTLVRTAAGFGLPLPLGGGPAAGGASGAGGGSGGTGPSIARIVVDGGVVRVEDRTAEPPWSLALEDLHLDVVPASGTIEGAGRLAGDGGRIEIAGSVAQGIALKLAGVKTDLLQPWLGAGLVHPGGQLAGDVELHLPTRVTARLTGTELNLLSGEAPLGEAHVELDLTSAGGAWRADKLDLRAAGTEIHGRGRLMPDVALDFELPPTPIESVLGLARALFPLPLQIAPPGSAQATLHFEQPSGANRPSSYEARGKLSAARLHAVDLLPEATDVRASFELSRSGALTVRIEDGKMAGGPLRGVARLDRVYPPGKLVLDGDLAQASLGQLLAGFVQGAPERIVGLTAADASIVVDLGRAAFDARSLGGRLKLQSGNVQLPGFDLEGALRAAIADKLSVLGDLGRSRPAAEGPAGGAAAAVAQVIDRLEAEIDFDALPWGLKGLVLRAGKVTATGDGTFDPLAGGLDLRVAVLADAALTAQLIGRYPGLSQLTRSGGTLTVPARIRGTLAGPKIGIDAGALARQSLGGGRPQDAVRGLVEGLLEKKKKKEAEKP